MLELKASVGDIVKAEYKSGQYIGELVEDIFPRAKVKILAVIKHPEQGDIHHPKNPDVKLFHQRRALAYQEIAVVPVRHIEPYNGEIPDYKASLKAAIDAEIEEVEKLVKWGQASLAHLHELRGEYFNNRS